MAEGLAPLGSGAFPLSECRVLTRKSLWILWHIGVVVIRGGSLWEDTSVEVSCAFALPKPGHMCGYQMLPHVPSLSFVLRHLPQYYGFHDKFLLWRVAL